MAFEHLYSNNPVEREIEYRGQTQKVYFRRLTAGERMQVRAGNKGQISKEGNASFNLDLGDIDLANHKLVHFATCEENGKPAFKSLAEVQRLPEDLFVLFVNEAKEVTSADETPEAAGNV